MNSDALREAEYRVLRETIARRGSLRVLLIVVTLTAWASLGVVLVLLSPVPLHSTLPLAILTAGFEAIYALHVGVERIGRYLQVFYEETAVDGVASAPRWETLAMAPVPA